MIVTCPNCQTRYNLPDAKVPPGGAKVKCSKCAQVFKAEPPPSTPEEEVETLLEKESETPDTQAGDEFDETFDEVASGDKPADEPADETVPDESDAVEEGMPDMDDLFDDTDEAPAPDEGPSPTGGLDQATADDVESLFGDDDGDLFGDDADESAESADDDADDLFADDDTGDLFADDDDSGADDGAADDDGGVADDEDEDTDNGFGLDAAPKKKKKKQKKGSKSLGCLIIILIMAVGLGAAIYFRVWTMFGLDLGSYFKNVPYIGSMFMEDMGGEEEAAPGESPADRVRKIELKNVKQYYVANEKTGNLFVVEGKAVNKFSVPKEQIKVEVVLYDETGNVLVSQSFLCGNVLSQFQLQVQTQKEIEDGLSSEVGILSNNTFIRPGASTPFMAVFFQPPAGVKEFLVKVVDVGDTE